MKFWIIISIVIILLGIWTYFESRNEAYIDKFLKQKRSEELQDNIKALKEKLTEKQLQDLRNCLELYGVNYCL